jgi:hypothetical protein
MPDRKENTVKNAKMIRQGDVLLVPVDEIPDEVRPVARVRGALILAEGELSGHAHAILDERADLYEFVAEDDIDEMRRRFLKVEAEVALVHEEHAQIALTPGTYEVRRQREYAPQERFRPVFD